MEGFRKYVNFLYELLLTFYVQDNRYTFYNFYWLNAINVEEPTVVLRTWPVPLHGSIVDGHKTAFGCSNKEEGVAIFEDIFNDTSEEVIEGISLGLQSVDERR